jgi:signal transduction histidine kinase/ActR/RegA family two-component response regulator
MTQSSSLRRRLTALIVRGSVVTALIAAAGFSWLDLNRFWDRTSAEVSAVSNIVADQVGAAVALRDAKAAREILASLRSDDRLRDAILYDSGETCFASFHRTPVEGCPRRPADGIRRERDAFVIARPVTAGDERVGTLMLAAGLPSIASLLRQFLGGAALIIVLSLAVAAVLAVVLQSRVSAPILDIAKVARRMAQTHQFRERVSVTSSDEVGVLANSFNTMVEEIETRDAQLAEQRRQLELEVAERSRVNIELREAKERAEDAARLKSQFLANMSHEIRTPLNGVTGMISLALDRCAGSEEREQLQVALGAAQSLSGILNDILDFSRIEAGKMAIESIAFDLHATVRECLRIFDLAVRDKSLRLRVEIAPGCPRCVQGDPARLRQVLINLAGNAVKFTIEGEVAVRVAAADSGVLRFEIADTGIGIPKDKLDSIFEAFTQADGSHSRRFGGSGLGLTITRRLVELMGGRLWAESEVGCGSRFLVELPLAASCDCVEPAASPVAAPRPALPPLHILVAEDNLVNQRVVCGILKRQGWTVALALNGEQALERFLLERFDAILMDIQMPKMDGLEATDKIRNQERQLELPRTPIIALTAHASQSQHRQCIAHGMDAVVTKPIDLTTLLDVIARVLSPVTAPV